MRLGVDLISSSSKKLDESQVLNVHSSLNEISHAHVRRILPKLHPTPPQGQETSARAKLKRTHGLIDTGGRLTTSQSKNQSMPAIIKWTEILAKNLVYNHLENLCVLLSFPMFPWKPNKTSWRTTLFCSIPNYCCLSFLLYLYCCCLYPASETMLVAKTDWCSKQWSAVCVTLSTNVNYNVWSYRKVHISNGFRTAAVHRKKRWNHGQLTVMSNLAIE